MSLTQYLTKPIAKLALATALALSPFFYDSRQEARAQDLGGLAERVEKTETGLASEFKPDFSDWTLNLDKLRIVDVKTEEIPKEFQFEKDIDNILSEKVLPAYAKNKTKAISICKGLESYFYNEKSRIFIEPTLLQPFQITLLPDSVPTFDIIPLSADLTKINKNRSIKLEEGRGSSIASKDIINFVLSYDFSKILFSIRSEEDKFYIFDSNNKELKNSFRVEGLPTLLYNEICGLPIFSLNNKYLTYTKLKKTSNSNDPYTEIVLCVNDFHNTEKEIYSVSIPSKGSSNLAERLLTEDLRLIHTFIITSPKEAIGVISTVRKTDLGKKQAKPEVAFFSIDDR